jgi:hypothetical protein
MLARPASLPVALVFTALMCILPGPAFSQLGYSPELESKTVLVLNSLEVTTPVFMEMNNGLKKAFQKAGLPSLNQRFEALELRRYNSPQHRSLLLDQMRLRYGGQKIDMIVTVYPEALEFVLNDCKDVFSGVPVLAAYLPEGYKVQKPDRPVIEHHIHMDIAGTLQIALGLMPHAKRVYVVSGEHIYD